MRRFRGDFAPEIAYPEFRWPVALEKIRGQYIELLFFAGE
jgi:hypothetical protein